MALKRHEYWRTKFTTKRLHEGRIKTVTVFNSNSMIGGDGTWVATDGTTTIGSYPDHHMAIEEAEKVWPTEDVAALGGKK